VSTNARAGQVVGQADREYSLGKPRARLIRPARCCGAAGRERSRPVQRVLMKQPRAFDVDVDRACQQAARVVARSHKTLAGNHKAFPSASVVDNGTSKR